MQPSHVNSLDYDETYDSGARSIILRPPRQSANILPSLAFDWTALDSEQPCMTLELGLFILDDGNIRFIGYRYETPECNRYGGPAHGAHDFYHSQPIIGYRQAQDLRAHSIRWLPDDMPASPLAAKTPFDLFASMLVALHGKQIIDELLKRVRLTGNYKRRLEGFPEWT